MSLLVTAHVLFLSLSLLPSWSSAATLAAYGAGAGDTTSNSNPITVSLPTPINVAGSPQTYVSLQSGAVFFGSSGDYSLIILETYTSTATDYRIMTSSEGSFSSTWSSIYSQVTSDIPATFTPTYLLIATFEGTTSGNSVAFQMAVAWNDAGTAYSVQLVVSPATVHASFYCVFGSTGTSVLDSSGGAFAFALSSMCQAGYYGDGTCTACPAGTYNPSSGVSTVAGCLPCAAGSYNPSTGQSSCTSCDPGTYNPNTGATLASNCTQCRGGSYNPTTRAASCTTCPVGSYCTAGAINPTACKSRSQCPRTGMSGPSATPSRSKTHSTSVSDSGSVSASGSVLASGSILQVPNGFGMEDDMYQKATEASSIAAGGLAAAALVAFVVHTCLVSTPTALTTAAPPL